MADARNDLVKESATASGSMPVEWRRSQGLIAYEEAVAAMEARAAAIAEATARELVWLLEHPPLYTAGTSAKAPGLIEPRFPVHATGRGGQFTYHGPGQRVVYVVLDLRRRGQDVRRFVATLEEWIIRTLAVFGVTGERREHRVGVWVCRTEQSLEREDKIAAIGLRLKRWVTLHGIALNVSCELSHYSGIVPCGVFGPRYGITSLADLGVAVTMAEVDAALHSQFEVLFGRADPPCAGTAQAGAARVVTRTI
jgi:lipoyl(octanoyl) transferase